jgi:hypothetical protein
VEGSVVSSHASSVARQLKEVELEKAKRKASLDQERRRIEADERRIEAELRKAELEDQQKILDLEADLEKDKILEGSSQDLDHIDPDDDEAGKPPDDPIETWMKKNDDIEQKSNPGSGPRAPALVKQVTPSLKIEPLPEETHSPGGGGAEHDVLRFARRKLRDLPNFDGNPMEWPLFVSQFNMTTKTDRVSQEDNIYRLQKCLKGKAKEAVQSMLLVAGNVDLVLKTLERRFGRADVVVESLIQKVKGVPACKDGKPEMFIDLSDMLNNLVSTMVNMKCEKYLCSPELLREVARKIPPTYQQTWCDAFGPEKALDLKDLAVWMTEKADRIAVHSSLFSTPWTCAGKPPEQRRLQPQRVFATSENSEDSSADEELREKKRTCAFCDKSGHEIGKCRSIGQRTVQERWDWAKQKSLCFRCLKAGHRSTKCRSGNSCGKDGCSSSHHSLLHPTSESFQQQQESVTQETLAHVTAHISKPNRVLLKVLPVTLIGPAGKFSTYAMLDGGSTVTLVAEEVAKRIGASGPEEKLNISWINAAGQKMSSQRVGLIIQGDGEKKNYKLNNVRTVRNLKLPAQSMDHGALIKQYPHLETLNDLSMKNAVPTILIGADNDYLSIADSCSQGPRGAPFLTWTKLGYTIHGPNPKVEDQANSEFSFFTWNTEEDGTPSLPKECQSTEAHGVQVPVGERKALKAALRDVFQDLGPTSRRAETCLQTRPWNEESPEGEEVPEVVQPRREVVRDETKEVETYGRGTGRDATRGSECELMERDGRVPAYNG